MLSRNALLSFLPWLFICASHLYRVLALLFYSVILWITLVQCEWSQQLRDLQQQTFPRERHQTRLQNKAAMLVWSQTLNSAISIPGTFQQRSGHTLMHTYVLPLFCFWYTETESSVVNCTTWLQFSFFLHIHALGLVMPRLHCMWSHRIDDHLALRLFYPLLLY